jgi:hypothetical protein
VRTGVESIAVDSEGTPAPRAQVMRFQGFANGIVRGLLRTPGLDRVVGKWLVTVYAVGRKSGRRYSVPVAYTRHEGVLLIGTPFAWARNLRTGEPVQIRLAGRLRTADVEVRTDEAGVIADFAVMSRANPQFAKFNQVRRAADGTPDPDDLRLAWLGGARAIRLTPR